jgi:molybdopterin-containing oxidoreductase family molybdopterin binding subunit
MAKGEKSFKVWEDKWIKTVCGMCYAHCAIRVRRINGVPVKIEGEPDSNFGGCGGICGKGVSGLAFLHDPNRLDVPLRRTNPEKGIGVDPKWKEISWEEALTEIGDKWKKIMNDDPRKLWFGFTTIHGATGGMFTMNLALRCGGAAIPGGGAVHCGNGAHYVAGLSHGAWSIAPDWKYTNYVILWGASKGTAAGHSMVIEARLRSEALNRGIKIVTFDPMCNSAGGKATEWIPILPGTDGAVALAMANIILNELGVYDKEYLANKTNLPYLVRSDGRFIRDNETNKCLVWDNRDNRPKTYDDPTIGDYALEGTYQISGVNCQPAFVPFKESLKQWTPEKASEISTVPESKIRRIAGEFAENARVGSTINLNGITFPYRPVASCIFRGAEGHTNSMQTCAAVELLNELVGACDVPGGCLGWPAVKRPHPSTGHWGLAPVKGEDGILMPGLFYRETPWPPRLPKVPVRKTGCEDFFTVGHAPPFYYMVDGKEVAQKLGFDGKPEMMINLGLNLVVSVGNWDTVVERMKEIPFFVHLDLYSNETAEALADILLPVQSYLERFEWICCLSTFFNHPPTPDDKWYFHVGNPVIDKPIGQRRNEYDVLFELSDRVGVRDKLNDVFNTVFKLQGEDRLKPDEKLGWDEMGDKILKYLFGPEHGKEYFREHGYISYPKDIKETYWRPFTDARVPVYKEYLIDIGKRMREIAEKAGLQLDWEQYTSFPIWVPTIANRQLNDEYDLYCFSYRDIIHTGTQTPEIPWIDEVSKQNPYTYNITMNVDTAKKKGLKEDDSVWLETPYGRKVKGKIKLMEGQHPKTIGIAACLGLWAKGRPVSRNKGTNFDNLLELNLKHLDPISLNLETSTAVKIYKARDD